MNLLISPEAYHPKRLKEENRNTCMGDRIGFKTEELRKQFFWGVREAAGAKRWNELKDMLGLPRTTFQKYQYGQWLMPAALFDSMLLVLPEEKQHAFFNHVFVMPCNWGASKGGKNNFEKNKTEVLERLKEVRPKWVPGRKGYFKPVDLNRPLSRELCELIGAIIGDGSVDGHINKRGNSKYHLSITGDAKFDRDYLTKVMPTILRKLFKVKSHFYFRKDSRTMVLNFYSKLLFCLLTKRFGFIAGNKTYTVKIPEEILQAGEQFIFRTIRGIFDTDGCVFFDKRKPYKNPYPRVTLQIASEPLFLQLKTFLERHFPLYTYYRPKRRLFAVEVYGHKQFEKWMKLIGFSNQRHLNRIKENYKPEARIELAISR